MLKLEITFQKELEQMKSELERLPQFNLQKIFKFIDVNNYNFIDEAQIKKFLKK